ncbi:MAG: HlyD family efflux transporter periplasmic adaptor subunit [Balneolaceae bacterium]|nr:HlyD family efflux transporter periplasmic adaptor subunit [Balneolaceae bacterium]
MGRQDVALKDYQLVEDTLSAENRALVLREPQLESARASVQSVRAAVEQAEVELERTTIKAPFSAHILSRNVNVGSQVSPGNNLGRLVGLDEYWVEATVPQSHLQWLSFPQDGEQGSEVTVRNRTAWNPDEHRTGQLFKLVGSLEGQTRMARVLVSVAGPAFIP